MWVKRDFEEIVQLRKARYRSIKMPLLYSVALFIFLLIFIKLGYSRFSFEVINPISWGEFFRRGIAKAFFISTIIFSLLYFCQILRKKPIGMGSPTLLCSKCNSLKKNGKELKCKCGGEFISIDEMKWVEKGNSEEDKGGNRGIH